MRDPSFYLSWFRRSEVRRGSKRRKRARVGRYSKSEGRGGRSEWVHEGVRVGVGPRWGVEDAKEVVKGRDPDPSLQSTGYRWGREDNRSVLTMTFTGRHSVLGG